MTVEVATFINTLDATYPAATDAKSEGDDHIRLLKTTIKATFPNVTGALTPTHTQLNFVTGVTSPIQTQLDAEITVRTNADALKAALASPIFTGTPAAPTATPGTNTTQLATTAFVAAGDALLAPLASPALTGVPTSPTAIAGTSNSQIATTAFVAAAAFSAALPAQTGNAGKYVTTDGVSASWAAISNPVNLYTFLNFK